MFPMPLPQPMEFAFLLLRFLPHLSPLLQDELKGPQGPRLAAILLRRAYEVTQQSSLESAIAMLDNNPSLQTQFHQDILQHLLKELSLPGAPPSDPKPPSSDSKKLFMMMGVAVFGLLACLGSLTYFRSHLPGEAVGLLSTLVGIFGSCLKDVYRFEFGSR